MLDSQMVPTAFNLFATIQRRRSSRELMVRCGVGGWGACKAGVGWVQLGAARPPAWRGLAVWGMGMAASAALDTPQTSRDSGLDQCRGWRRPQAHLGWEQSWV